MKPIHLRLNKKRPDLNPPIWQVVIMLILSLIALYVNTKFGHEYIFPLMSTKLQRVYYYLFATGANILYLIFIVHCIYNLYCVIKKKRLHPAK